MSKVVLQSKLNQDLYFGYDDTGCLWVSLKFAYTWDSKEELLETNLFSNMKIKEMPIQHNILELNEDSSNDNLTE